MSELTYQLRFVGKVQAATDRLQYVTINYGEPQKSLEDLRPLLDKAEAEWTEWFDEWAQGDYPEPPASDWRGIYEGCDVEALCSDGRIYELDGDENWEDTGRYELTSQTEDKFLDGLDEAMNKIDHKIKERHGGA